jgi:hypothetical protein
VAGHFHGVVKITVGGVFCLPREQRTNYRCSRRINRAPLWFDWMNRHQCGEHETY